MSYSCFQYLKFHSKMDKYINWDKNELSFFNALAFLQILLEKYLKSLI